MSLIEEIFAVLLYIELKGDLEVMFAKSDKLRCFDERQVCQVLK